MFTSKGQLCLATMLAAIAAGDARAAGSQPEGAPTPTTVKLPAGPGSVRGLTGDPSVSVFTGQASYSVPLELPGAARGFAPKVELAYRGDLGNGPLGIGWGVAVPKIVRSTRQGVPKYLASDELELVGVGAGGRLISIGLGEWRVEGQGNLVRVVQNGVGYTVYGPDGTRYQLGVSAAARQDSSGKIAAWLAESIVDVAGQSVAFQYHKDQGEIYLSRIGWGPSGQLSASFELETRADVVKSYALGFQVITNQRVAAVRVEAFGEVLRRYELDYDEGFAVSRLSSVRMTGRGGQGQMPVTTFSYAPQTLGQTQLLGTGDWRLDANTVLVDVDGDGAADLLRLQSTGHSYRQNRAGQFATPVAMTGATGLTLASSRLADVEGKARANLVTVVNGNWVPYKIAGNAWSSLGTWAGTTNVPVNGSSVVLAELNGDGRVDAVQWNANGLIVRFANATGLDAAVSKPKIGGTLLPGPSVRWHDVNADGLSDAMLVGDAYISAYHGRGDGTFTTSQTIAWPWGGPLGTADVRFADLNRDGLLDLVRVNPSDVAWYRGRAGGGFETQAVTLAHPADDPSVVVAIDDANGNGSADVIWSSSSGVRALDVAGATTAGMLVGVDNGLGKTVTIAYDATTAIAGRDADAGNPWLWKLPISIPVVKQTVTASGTGDPARTIDFTLRDGFWDAAENRFGGFLLGKRIVRGGSLAPDLVEETRFHSGTGTTRVLRGMPTIVRIENGAGNLISITTNTWRAHRVTSLPDTTLLRKAVLDKTAVDHYEGQGGIPRTTRVTYTIDGEGRTSGEYHEGRIDVTGDEKRIERTFAVDDTLWVRDLVAEDKQLAADGSIVTWQRTYYGDHQSEQALYAAGRGWQRRVEGWLASESRWVTQSTRDYDALGNPIRFVNGDVEYSVGYDPNGLHPIREAITIDDGELVWTSEWDAVLGKPTARTSPDAVTMRVGYDSLGRVASEAVGSALPHKVYRYQWNAPRPYTESFVFDRALADVTAMPATWTPRSGWRHEVAVTNGAGESLYTATELAAGQWIVSSWTERDAAGRPYFLGDSALVSSATPLITARPPGMVGQTLQRDALGRATLQTLADGSTKQFAYTAFTTTTTVSGLAPVVATIDGLGRSIETRRESEIAKARYDAADRTTALELYRGTLMIAQSFTFDTLGRMRTSVHPDGGTRVMLYDDASRLIRETNATGQYVALAYDSAGRIATRSLDDGTTYRYHYDTPRVPGGATNTAGRLAWVEEPTGYVEYSYDAQGNLARQARSIDGVSGGMTTSYAASGLVLVQHFDDAYKADRAYDAAGRLVRVGDVWQLEAQDAAGRPLDERFGNGVQQTTARDVLGLAQDIVVMSPSGSALLSTQVDRNAWGAITAITDDDGRGLDHGATFTYDARARLHTATLGSGLVGHSLAFEYDDFQNMTARTVTGSLPGVMAGTYQYSENGAGPRQLTSIVDGAGATLHTFGFDVAGRQTSVDDQQLSFDALDRLVQVDGADTVAYAYGHDGERIKTTRPDGSIRRSFTADVSETDGGREYVITANGRALARVRVTETEGGSGTAGLAVRVDPARGLGIAALLVIVLAVAALVRRGRPRTRVGAGAAFALLVSCGSPGHGELVRAATVTQIVYFHHGTAAGPILFTDDAGAVVEERRHEPFGAPVDALDATGQGTPPDFRTLDQGVLGKPIDSTTGWSFHGARWYQPESARWTSIDPPTLRADAATYLTRPWSLHPYQYVDQNPVVFWDPDGRDREPLIVEPEKTRPKPRPQPKTEIEKRKQDLELARALLDNAKQIVTEKFEQYDRAASCRVIYGCGLVLAKWADDELAEALDNANDYLSRYRKAERALERQIDKEERAAEHEAWLAEARKGWAKLAAEREAMERRQKKTTSWPSSSDTTPVYLPCDWSSGCRRTIHVQCTGEGCTVGGGTRQIDTDR